MTTPVRLHYRTIPQHKVVNSLPAATQVLLSTLYWHQNSHTGQLNPRHATLARELNWSYWKVQGHMRTLREAQIVTAVKGQRGNKYEILPHENWVVPESHKCRSKQTGNESCVGVSAEAKTPRQEVAILIERQTILLKEEVAAAAAYRYSAEGGGGAPAAPGASAQESPKPSTPQVEVVPAPIPEPSLEVRKEPRCSHPPKVEVEASAAFSEAAALVDELAPIHPTPGNLERARAAIARVLRAGGTADFLRESHGQYRKLWAVYRPGRFIPQLWRWIDENDWRNPPNELQIEASMCPEALERREAERAAAERVSYEAKLKAWREEEAREEAERQEKERQLYEKYKREGRLFDPNEDPHERIARMRRQYAEQCERERLAREGEPVA